MIQGRTSASLIGGRRVSWNNFERWHSWFTGTFGSGDGVFLVLFLFVRGKILELNIIGVLRAVPLASLPFFLICRWRYALLNDKLIFHPIVALSPILLNILRMILINFCCCLRICDSSYTLKMEELLLISTAAVGSVIVKYAVGGNVRHLDADWGLNRMVNLCLSRDVSHLSGQERFFWLAQRGISRHNERVRRLLMHASLFVFWELDLRSTLFLIVCRTCSPVFVVSELLLLIGVRCLHHFKEKRFVFCLGWNCLLFNFLKITALFKR